MNVIEKSLVGISPIVTSGETKSLLPTETEQVVNLLSRVFADGKNYNEKILHNPELVSCVTVKTRGEIIGYGGAIERTLVHNGEKYIIGGVADVAVDPKYRKLGLGLEIMRNINHIFETKRYDIGMGFCHPDLLTYYEKVHWFKKPKGKVFITKNGIDIDKGVTILYSSNPAFSFTSFWFTDNLRVGNSDW